MARPPAVDKAYDLGTQMWAGSKVHLTDYLDKDWKLQVLVPEDILLFVWDDAIYYTRVQEPGFMKWSAEKFIDVMFLHPSLHHRFKAGA